MSDRDAGDIDQLIAELHASAGQAASPGTGDTGRLELAQSFVHRHIPAVQLNAGRISSGDASRIARYDKILGLTTHPI